MKPVITVVAMRCYAVELPNWRAGKFKAKMESTKRVQKPNFSAAECTLILQLVEENIETIRETFSNSLTNKKKNDVWQMMADHVSAIGVVKRTPNDLREVASDERRGSKRFRKRAKNDEKNRRRKTSFYS